MKHFIFLILLIIISCKKAEPQIKILQKDTDLDLRYEVLNQLIESDSSTYAMDKFLYITTLRRVYLYENESDEPKPIGITLKYDSIFSQKDSAYYRNQEKIILGFGFDKTRINQKLQYATDEELHKLDHNKGDDFWTEFEKKYGRKCIRSFSVPFFNKDKTMCIVQNSISCGYLNANGYTAIYKKINGKWTEIKSFDHWIS
ncbi:hypothetical protein HNP38_003304 [Chryseobacterium defluvii]|uniref:Lipoprotein n=1 Tax=Chryseobacterium defluvii TaxID=160396 RepID=A0A840KJX0_9FLAO|nr:hypothetical protein [Chryseobacterium defluvii]MBB4807964.1 hypothetical protein [Chryseobacterium defluvii]